MVDDSRTQNPSSTCAFIVSLALGAFASHILLQIRGMDKGPEIIGIRVSLERHAHVVIFITGLFRPLNEV